MLHVTRTVGRRFLASSASSASSAAAFASTAASIGFIGLGNMGAHMARNLLKDGHRLAVYDLSAGAVQLLQRAGATAAESPKALAASADVVITMLPSSPHVQDIYGHLIPAARAGALLVDCSTIDPAVSRALAKQAADRGLAAVDAPVSGGVGGAEAGTLTFMVGGPDAAFERAKPVLQRMGKNIVHCGASGNGQVAKICNNMLLGITMIGTAEAMNLGVRMGMDPKQLAAIINTSSGRNWSCDTYNPCPGVMPNVPASRGYTGGFGSALMCKDLGLASAAASGSSSAVHLGKLAHEVYERMLAAGYAGKDFSAVYEWLSQHSGGDAAKKA